MVDAVLDIEGDQASTININPAEIAFTARNKQGKKALKQFRSSWNKLQGDIEVQVRASALFGKSVQLAIDPEVIQLCNELLRRAGYGTKILLHLLSSLFYL